MAPVPRYIAPRFVGSFLLPLTALRTVSSHEAFREHLPATVIPMTALPQLLRSGNECQNV